MYYKTLILFLHFLMSYKFISAKFECDEGWVQHYEYCYYKLENEMNYRAALDNCAKLHADLLTINTKKEDQFVNDYFLTKFADVWVDAFNSEYNNWFNLTGLPPKCAIVHEVKKEGRWFKENCENENEVVCKKFAEDHQPSTTTLPSTTTIFTTEISTETSTEITEITSNITTESTTESTTQSYHCPVEWVYFNKKCYRANHKKLTGDDAHNACRKLNSKSALTSIYSQEENDFVVGLLNDYGHKEAIIGLIKVWILPFWWDDGSIPGYTNWGSFCPKPFDFKLFTIIRRYDGGWCNIHPTETYYSICAFSLE